jgi:hypothetical protein
MMGLINLGKKADAAAEGIDRLKAQAEQEAVARDAALQKLGGAAAGAAGAAFPGQPAAPAGPAGHRAPTAEQMALMQQASELQNVQRMLAEQGHPEKAAGLEPRIQGLLTQVNQLNQQQETVADAVVQQVVGVLSQGLSLTGLMVNAYARLSVQLGVLSKDQQKMAGQIKNLGQARA